jgi:ATP-dependent DNA ligase
MEEAGPEIEETLLAAIAGGAEGLMLKFLDSRCAYEPSKRAGSWLKLKKDYCEGLRDSLDLVLLLFLFQHLCAVCKHALLGCSWLQCDTRDRK